VSDVGRFRGLAAAQPIGQDPQAGAPRDLLARARAGALTDARAPMASAVEREIHELAGQLRAAASAWAAGDGSFDEVGTTRLRRRAIALCHAHYRAAIP